MEILFVFAFIYGACIGSFLNVVIYRTPRGESLVSSRSHCTSCGTEIKWYDLFPIFSWIFLGGKCRSCGEKISPRYMIVESLTGFLFLFSAMAVGFDFHLLIAVILMSVLVVLSFIDIDHMEIPYWCSITIAVLGLIEVAYKIGFEKANAVPVLIEAGVGLICISLPFAILAVLGAMGGGDVQLMAAAGLLLGYRIIPAALIGIFAGAVYGIALKISAKRNAKSANQAETDDSDKKKGLTEMVFGPFLSIGIAVCFLWGSEIIRWYLGLMS